MRSVGIRELKDRLSEYVRYVRSGETVLVTDRGEVVAELAPPGRAPGHPALPPGVAELARRGLLTAGAPGTRAPAYPALSPALRKTTSAQLLQEEREGR
jgi:antitoxin (DNA-binding transcriptional repressor) of toxin-antitoxin stability system